MPEGHTIHRQVVDQAPALVGRLLAVTSPGGRLADRAAAVDGRRLEAMDAWGKHLFYCFEGRRVLHVHLGLDGRFRLHRAPAAAAPPAGRSVALRIAGPDLTCDLSAPRVCEVLDELGRRRVVEALGPDPIRTDDGADAVAGWDRFDGPVGAALLDQSLAAGIGNIYRAEILFACGLHPERSAASVTTREWEAVWATAVRLLRAGVRDGGRIVTVDPRDRAVRDRRRTYVYGQRFCARCGSAVRRWDLLGREAWACETCQPPAGLLTA